MSAEEIQQTEKAEVPEKSRALCLPRPIANGIRRVIDWATVDTSDREQRIKERLAMNPWERMASDTGNAMRHSRILKDKSSLSVAKQLAALTGVAAEKCPATRVLKLSEDMSAIVERVVPREHATTTDTVNAVSLFVHSDHPFFPVEFVECFGIGVAAMHDGTVIGTRILREDDVHQLEPEDQAQFAAMVEMVETEAYRPFGYVQAYKKASCLPL